MTVDLESTERIAAFQQARPFDLNDNVNRARFGEYLVKDALGVACGYMPRWAGFDLLYEGTTKVEVKTSGDVQTWKSARKVVTQWDIEPKRPSDPESGQAMAGSVPVRAADVYVLWHRKKDRSWDAYVIPTWVLDKKFGDQKGIGLGPVERLVASRYARKASFETLKAAVDDMTWEPVLRTQFFVEPDEDHPWFLARVFSAKGLAEAIYPNDPNWRQVNSMVSFVWDSSGIEISRSRAEEFVTGWARHPARR